IARLADTIRRPRQRGPDSIIRRKLCGTRAEIKLSAHKRHAAFPLVELHASGGRMLDQNPQAKSAIGKIRGGCARLNLTSDLTFREFSWRRVGKVIEILRADELAA